MVNPKLPTWNGDWKTFSDFRFACLLELDGCKEEDRCLLAPRLVRNLTDRAWECALDINREDLRKATGVEYLSKYLKERRGKEEVDLLGDALQQYFQSQEVYRRDGENLNDFEQRHAGFLRDITKAMTETGRTATVPTEIYGWFVINKLLKLEASDIAMVKAQATSYRLEDVMTAMRKMWGGDSLGRRDAERKRGSQSRTYAAIHDGAGWEDINAEKEAVLLNAQEDESFDSEEDLEESHAWFEQASMAFQERPQDETVLANFQEARKNLYREARKALDKHRVSRGFYPTSSGKGKGKDGAKGFQGRCMRCGKVGHKAMQCRQSMNAPSQSTGSSGKSGDSGRVGFVFGNHSEATWTPQVVSWAPTEEIFPLAEPSFAAITDEINTKAILDCGASESIIGAFTLQNLYDQYVEHGMDPEKEISIDRNQRRSFVFGNNETSLSLGYAHITAGIAGNNMKIPLHIVEGQTPLLLSSRWLEQHAAVINFRTGEATFGFLGDKPLQLERASTNHLLLPLTSFAPRASTTEPGPPCGKLDEVSHCEAFANRQAAVPI